MEKCFSWDFNVYTFCIFYALGSELLTSPIKGKISWGQYYPIED